MSKKPFYITTPIRRAIRTSATATPRLRATRSRGTAECRDMMSCSSQVQTNTD